MDFRTGYCTRLLLILHYHDGDVASLSNSNPRIVYLGCILTTVSVYIKGSPDTSSSASNKGDDFGEDDMDLLQSPFNVHVETNSVDYAVRYRRHVLKPDGPPLRIYINRLQEEFASDVLRGEKLNYNCCTNLFLRKSQNLLFLAPEVQWALKVYRVCSIHFFFECFEPRPYLVCHVTTIENV